MRFHLVNNGWTMKRILFSILFAVCTFGALSANVIPPKPEPPRLVNDYANILDASAERQLEETLAKFARETSTQVVIVTVSSLDGYPIGDFAVELGHSWGVGQSDNDNGIVIAVKPPSVGERGEAFIATGYGLEGAVPDAIARRIVDNEMIPQFKNGDYHAGLLSAVAVIMDLTRGEYTADEYIEQTGSVAIAIGAFFIIIFIILIISIVTRAKNIQSSSIGHDIPIWTLMAMMGSMSQRHGGSWENFSSGRGSFGGGFGGGFRGGGFGGFGGGGFGGGGAGGSW